MEDTVTLSPPRPSHTHTPPATDRQPASREAFRDGMAHLAAAVNIITTDGPGGRAGFTATAVCSVTDSPPTLLVCLNATSSAAEIFGRNSALCVNTIAASQTEIAMAFGGKIPMPERFAGAQWHRDVSGAPVLTGASVAFDCRITDRKEIGTHIVLFCEVLAVAQAGTPSASVYFARKFHHLEA